ncbi:hypothetical protein ACU635_29800 [[Actinomadura] parvosata]|uniref:hypothetical protein n=1 Tax=[Actinomadura] parvosata TaxID=1955412 RepID=UPI00406C5125
MARTRQEVDAKVASLRRHIRPEGFLAQRGGGIDLAACGPDELIDDIVACGGDFTERAVAPAGRPRPEGARDVLE